VEAPVAVLKRMAQPAAVVVGRDKIAFLKPGQAEPELRLKGMLAVIPLA